MSMNGVSKGCLPRRARNVVNGNGKRELRRAATDCRREEREGRARDSVGFWTRGCVISNEEMRGKRRYRPYVRDVLPYLNGQRGRYRECPRSARREQFNESPVPRYVETPLLFREPSRSTTACFFRHARKTPVEAGAMKKGSRSTRVV